MEIHNRPRNGLDTSQSLLSVKTKWMLKWRWKQVSQKTSLLLSDLINDVPLTRRESTRDGLFKNSLNGSSGPFRIIMMMLPCRSTYQELTITRPISTHRYPSPLSLSYTCVDFKHRIDLLIKCPSSLIFINVSTRPSFIWIQKWPADSYHFLLILLWATRIEPSILVCNHDQWFMYFGH